MRNELVLSERGFCPDFSRFVDFTPHHKRKGEQVLSTLLVN